MRRATLLGILAAAVLVGSAYFFSLGGDPTSRAPRDAEEPAVQVVETAWTRAAAEREERRVEQSLTQNPQGLPPYALPELRVYDRETRLVLHEIGIVPGKTAALLRDKISSGRAIKGPSLEQTLADLETADGHPAAHVVAPNGKIIVVDYWAEWCVPCKALEKELLAWAGSQPSGKVQIVRAEADLMKLARSRGDEVIMVKKDASGKLVPMNSN